MDTPKFWSLSINSLLSDITPTPVIMAHAYNPNSQGDNEFEGSLGYETKSYGKKKINSRNLN